MLLFKSTGGLSFIKGLFEVFAIWALIVKCAEFVWQRWGIFSPPLIWAYTAATGFALLYLFGFICMTRHAIFQSRIEECAAAKKQLEEQILLKRLSSKG